MMGRRIFLTLSYGLIFMLLPNICLALALETYSELLTQAEENRLNGLEKNDHLVEQLEIRSHEASAEEIARFHLLRAHRAALSGNINDAHKRLEEIISSTPSADILARAYSLSAQLYMIENNYADAYMNLSEALKLLNRVNDAGRKVDILEVAARLLALAKAGDKAIEYGVIAVQTAKKEGDAVRYCIALSALADAYYSTEKYSDSLRESIEMEQACRPLSQHLYFSSLAGQAMSLVKTGNRSEAESKFREAASGFRKLGYELGVAENQTFLAQLLYDNGAYPEAENLLNSAIPLLLNYKMYQVLATAHQLKSGIFEKREDWKSAINSLRQASMISEDALFKKNDIALAYYQVKFEIEAQDRKIESLQQEKNILSHKAQSQSEKRRLLQFGVGAVSVICILLMLALHRLRNQSLQLRKLAQIDGLTGLHNRRHALMLAEQLYASCLRRNSPLAVVMVDLDLFKEINDRFGHAAGDEVLRNAARHFASCLRKQDVIGRTGGEEFAIFLPDTDLNAAITVVERCRTGVGEVQEGEQRRSVTASFGIAVAINDRFTLDELLQQADKALYNAKASGRNQVAIARDLAFAASAYDEPASLI